MRESQRMNSLNFLVANRDICSDVVLSNGQALSRGSSVAALLYCMNHNLKVFQNPEEFDGERFLKLREKSEYGDDTYGGNKGPKWGLLDIHPETNVNFGFGKHVCPGRIMSVNAVSLFSISSFSSFPFAQNMVT